MFEKILDSFERLPSIKKGAIQVVNILSRQECPGASVATIKLDGINDRCRNLDTDATYTCFDGDGYFILWTGETHELVEMRPGVSISIPRGIYYQNIGKMTMISVNTPAFNAERVEYSE